MRDVRFGRVAEATGKSQLVALPKKFVMGPVSNASNALNLNCDRFRPVPAKPNEPKYKVGDRIQITLNNKIVEATITAIVQRTDGLRLQVAYGHDLSVSGPLTLGTRATL